MEKTQKHLYSHILNESLLTSLVLLITHQSAELLYYTTYLYFHAAGMNNLDFIAITTPDFVMNYSHTPNGVMWSAKIKQVIIVKVPLTI